MRRWLACAAGAVWGVSGTILAGAGLRSQGGDMAQLENNFPGAAHGGATADRAAILAPWG